MTTIGKKWAELPRHLPPRAAWQKTLFGTDFEL